MWNIVCPPKLKCHCDRWPWNPKVNRGHLLVMTNHHTKLEDPWAMSSLLIDQTRFVYGWTDQRTDWLTRAKQYTPSSSKVGGGGIIIIITHIISLQFMYKEFTKNFILISLCYCTVTVRLWYGIDIVFIHVTSSSFFCHFWNWFVYFIKSIFIQECVNASKRLVAVINRLWFLLIVYHLILWL